MTVFRNSFRLATIGALVLLAAFAGGCATVLRGTKQDIYFNSFPRGAEVNVDGCVRGYTPTSVSLSRCSSHSGFIEKEGYEPYPFNIGREYNVRTISGNLLLGGLPGMALDTVSGAAYDLFPKSISATLKKRN